MGARARISDGPNSRHGRFNITRRQHGRLADENGIYLFAVHTGGSDPELLGSLATLAVIVEEERRPECYSGGAGREEYYQISASRPPVGSPGGDRGGK